MRRISGVLLTQALKGATAAHGFSRLRARSFRSHAPALNSVRCGSLAQLC
jgi:hypothetical protein